MSDFTNENGIVRVLIAIITFGMGIDCKGLHTVIHYGPAGIFEDYFQEAGRAGKDGLPSEAMLVTSKEFKLKKHLKRSKIILKK